MEQLKFFTKSSHKGIELYRQQRYGIFSKTIYKVLLMVMGE